MTNTSAGRKLPRIRLVLAWLGGADTEILSMAPVDAAEMTGRSIAALIPALFGDARPGHRRRSGRPGPAARRDQRASRAAWPHFPPGADRLAGRTAHRRRAFRDRCCAAPGARRRGRGARGRPRPYRVRRYPGRRPGTWGARRLVHPGPVSMAGRSRPASSHVTPLTDLGMAPCQSRPSGAS
jgi:hypothetical protein